MPGDPECLKIGVAREVLVAVVGHEIAVADVRARTQRVKPLRVQDEHVSGLKTISVVRGHIEAGVTGCPDFVPEVRVVRAQGSRVDVAQTSALRLVVLVGHVTRWDTTRAAVRRSRPSSTALSAVVTSFEVPALDVGGERRVVQIAEASPGRISFSARRTASVHISSVVSCAGVMSPTAIIRADCAE